MKTTEKLIPLKEAASRLGVTTNTLQNWAKAGIITIARLGNSNLAINESVIFQLQPSAKELEDMQSNLVRLKRNLAEETEQVMLADEYFRETNRFDKKCGSAVIRNIITSYIDFAELPTKRESEMLKAYISGDRFVDLAKKYDLSRERCRQILEKAGRRIVGTYPRFMSNKRELAEMRDKCHLLEEENKALRDCIQRDKEVLTKEDVTAQADLLSNYPLSTRLAGGLKVFKVYTFGDLTRMRRTTLLKIRGFGVKTLLELESFMEEHNLEFIPEED